MPPASGSGVIVVASLRQAWRHKRKFDAVLTLEDPVCRSADQLRFHRTPKPPHLVLAFEDVDDDSLGVQVASHEQVDHALAFARANVGGSLLIHCRHGVGRSAAMALAVIADRLGSDQEDAALKGLLAIRPQATPNLVVVKLADAVLERGGRLVAAVQAWEAASPHMRRGPCGEPSSRPIRTSTAGGRAMCERMSHIVSSDRTGSRCGGAGGAGLG